MDMLGEAARTYRGTSKPISNPMPMRSQPIGKSAKKSSTVAAAPSRHLGQALGAQSRYVATHASRC